MVYFSLIVVIKLVSIHSWSGFPAAIGLAVSQHYRGWKAAPTAY